MDWFNLYGLIIITVIMVPNIIFAFKCREGFADQWKNRLVEAIEQVGRFGCFVFMVINIPDACFRWWFDGAFEVYLIANAALTAAYCIIWAVCFKKSSVFRALALSIIPSVMFLMSGVLIGSVPLAIAAALFAPSHIAISYKNSTIKG